MGRLLLRWPIGAATSHAKLYSAKVIGLLRLVRLSNSIPAALLVVLGARLSHVALPNPTVGRAAVAMWCITAFGYLTNDLFDRREDRINKPDRPLTAGTVTVTEAVLFGGGLLGGALWVSTTLGWLEVGVASAVLALLTLYNLRLKATAGAGNLLIGLLAGAALISGAVAVHGIKLAPLASLVWPAATLACFITAREMVKTLEDIPGDRLVGKRTIAVAYGPVLTIRLVTWLSIGTALVSWLPWLQWGYSLTYLWLIQLGVSLPLCLAALVLRRTNGEQRPVLHVVRRMLWLLKGSYALGLLALWCR